MPESISKEGLAPPPKLAMPPRVAPPVATPPPVVARPPVAWRPIPVPPGRQIDTDMGDTPSDFPEMPKSAPSDDDSPSMIVQTTDTVNPAEAATSPAVEMDAEGPAIPSVGHGDVPPNGRASIVRPLLMLVLAPLLLVAAVMLAWGLMEWLW